jgi:hypothetical protein
MLGGPSWGPGEVAFFLALDLTVQPCAFSDSIKVTSGGISGSAIMDNTMFVPAISPLTTRFVPPSYCSMEYNICDINSYSCSFLLRDVTCGSDGYPTLASDCFPPVRRFPDISNWGDDISYSPAIACPNGWRTMSESFTVTETSGSHSVKCCPS